LIQKKTFGLESVDAGVSEKA